MNELYHIYTDNPIIILSIIVVIFFYFFKPKKINSWYGYRTQKSTQNQELWDLAQAYSAKLFLLYLTIAIFIQFITYKIIADDGISSLLTTGIFLIVSIIAIAKTEKKLKKKQHPN